MKKLVLKLAVACFALGFMTSNLVASPAHETSKANQKSDDPQQCLKELEKDTENEVSKSEDLEKDKKEPGVIDKIAKKHKLGSLHFQDIIELFY